MEQEDRFPRSDLPSVRVSSFTDRTPGGLSTILPLLSAYMQDPMGGSSPLSPVEEERLVRLLSQHTELRIAVARDRDTGDLVGCALAYRNISTFTARPFYNIHDLIVLPSWRDRGIGRRLLSCMETMAHNEGCGKITLEVRTDNDIAQGLYRKAGFEQCAPPMYYLQKRLS